MANFKRFCDLFFSFADPTVKKYCEELSRNRVWKKTRQLGFYQYPRGFDQNDLRFSLLGEAINSSRYKRYRDIISRDFGIIDKSFELFERRIEFNTRDAIERVLSLCMVIADGNYPAYTKNKDQPTVINELQRIIHLSTERDHKVKITLDTHKLDIERKRLVSKENDLTITILDRDQSSRITLSVGGRNNSGQKDPLRITSVLMGVLSILSKDLSFEILNIQYPCGCDKYLDWEHSLYSPFRSYGSEKISFTFRYLVLLPLQADEKIEALKQYYGITHDGQLVVRGIEIRRHDTPKFIREFQTGLLSALFFVTV